MLACRVPWKLIRAIVEREPAAAPTNNAHRGHPAYLFGAAAWKKAEAEAPAVISEPRAFLQKTRLGERVRCALTNHEMVEYPHVDKRQGRLQLLGQQAIRIGWLGGARGVLMGEDDRSGVQLQSALQHDTRINRGRIDRSMEHRLHGQHVVHAVHEHDDEYLIGLGDQLQAKVVPDRSGPFKTWPGFENPSLQQHDGLLNDPVFVLSGNIGK